MRKLVCESYAFGQQRVTLRSGAVERGVIAMQVSQHIDRQMAGGGKLAEYVPLTARPELDAFV